MKTMSRMSDILGVKEGQEFEFKSPTGLVNYPKSKIQDGRRWSFDGSDWVLSRDEEILCEMIAHPELIQPITNITEQQITAIKGRIAEGTPWAARDMDAYSHIFFYTEKPKLSSSKTHYTCSKSEFYSYSNNCDLYDFINFENSPVYLPELIDRSEEE